MRYKQWIGIGFFGVLTEARDFTNWRIKGNQELEKGIEIAKKIKDSGDYELKVFHHFPNEIDIATARQFLKDVGLGDTEITDTIDSNCAYLLLTNAFRLIGGKGEFCKTCKTDFETLTQTAFSQQAKGTFF